MSDDNPFTQQGIRELQRQAQVAAKHARQSAACAALAHTLTAGGDLSAELRTLAELLDKAMDPATAGKDKPDLKGWPGKLRGHSARIKSAIGQVTSLATQ